MLEKEQVYYQKNRAALREQYHGKRVLIIGDRVLGCYDSDQAAYEEGVKHAEPGFFMIKYIPENPAHETLHISPRIQYAN
jgi:hypothetical protein